MSQSLSEVMGRSSVTIPDNRNDSNIQMAVLGNTVAFLPPNSHDSYYTDIYPDYNNGLSVSVVLHHMADYVKKKAAKCVWTLVSDTVTKYANTTTTSGKMLTWLDKAAKTNLGSRLLGGLAESAGVSGISVYGYVTFQGLVFEAVKVIPMPVDLSASESNGTLSTLSNISRYVDGQTGMKTEKIISDIKKFTSSDVINLVTQNQIESELDSLGIPHRMPNQWNGSLWYQGGSIYNTVSNILAKDVIYGTAEVSNFDNNLESKIKSENYQKYGYHGDPYGMTKHETTAAETYKDTISFLKDQHLLTNYHTFEGFEMGSNNDWIIRVYPYTSYELRESRHTITPPLPTYKLRHRTTYTDRIESCILDTSGNDITSIIRRATNTVTNKVYKDLVERTDLKAPDDLDYKDDDYFSFGYDCPVLTYSVNIGTVKTESLRLFGGDTADIFSGMNYHGTLDLSILDDTFGSMTKYMSTYLNASYDIESASVAPYWACAFEIDLIILRVGKQVKHRFRFICNPIAYTPQFSGTGGDSGTECRVDISFGIIGMVTLPPTGYGPFVEDRFNTTYQGTPDPSIASIYNRTRKINMYNLKWRDIEINFGNMNKRYDHKAQK